MSIGRISGWVVGLLVLAVSVGAQEKVSTLPIAEPYKDKRILPQKTYAVEPDPDLEAEVYAQQTYSDAYTDEWDYPVPFDSSALTPRTVPEAELQRYRNDPRYQYADVGPQSRGPSLLSRLWMWLERFLFRPMSEATGPLFWQVVRIVLAGLIIAFLLSRLLGVNLGGLFRRHASGPSGAEAGPLLDVDDIEAVDLDRLLADAVTARQHRDAVRYRYLRVLQRLAAAGLVDWQKNKTNRDYLREVRRSDAEDLVAPFAEVTRLFAWVWYGAATVDDERAARIAHRFEQVEAQIPERGGRPPTRSRTVEAV